MQYFNFNGDIYTTNTPVISAGSPGLRYGSGLFETMKLLSGNLTFAREHFARLWKGLQLLKINIPASFAADDLIKEILSLASANKLLDARIRLAVYENSKDSLDYLIEATSLPVLKGFNKTGLNLGVFPNGKKVCDEYSHLKHNNFLVYYLAKKYAGANKFDDVVILNDKGNISDTSKANIFIVKGTTIFTPPLREGCIAGIIRRKVLDDLERNKYEVGEKPLTIDDLVNSDEIFITNSIIDMQWVKSFMGSKKGNKYSSKIFEKLFIKGLDV